MKVYQCEDSLEGVFTAIYNAYEDKSAPDDTYISLNEELLLFAEYAKVLPDRGKTEKVIRTLKKCFGEKDYMHLCYALSSPDALKAQAVYRTVARGLSAKARPGHLFDNLADDDVHKAFSLGRGAGGEEHHLRGFVRFEELENGILYSGIAPKNNVLTFLMVHFADRLPLEDFVLCDEKRGIFGIHPKGREWYLMQGENAPGKSPLREIPLSAGEEEYRELFRHFCTKIAIRERRNTALQQGMLPLRFREYMVEFR